MSVFSRDFTRTEKLLILVLALILLGLVYYNFVYKTTVVAIANAETEAEDLEKQITAAQARAMVLRSLQNKMDEMEAAGRLSYMGSYNNSKPEVAFLNDILADTLSYSISFANVSRMGNQIRRSFQLRYLTTTFSAAREIVDKLNEGENRCIVGNVKCTIANDGTTWLEASATFYETMVGGTVDAGLPADAAVANK